MSWFNTQGQNPEIILFSRACYTRNVSKLPFSAGGDSKKLSELYSKIDRILTGNGFHAEMLPSGNSAAVLALAEKQLISADLVFGEGKRVVYLNEPCNLTVSLGGLELISIQSIMPGRAVSEAKNSASGAEELLDGELSFAYSESIGYLSPHPTHCGSCLELCAALYLPSLRLLSGYEDMRRALLQRGAILSPMFTHADNAGDLYTLSYTPEHLSNEENATLYFDSLLRELAANEQKHQKMLFPDAHASLTDKAARALGILKCAMRMSECEMLSLISDIRLSITAQSQPCPMLPAISDLNYLCVEGLDCSLISSSNQKCSSLGELERLRADFLRNYISAKVKTEVGA
ncbi:MAG: hypothetical protein E7649_01300 [Ruminococcaceae bacterium]|nr:hypothetical protein [Oscillospiraceae bacterium]